MNESLPQPEKDIISPEALRDAIEHGDLADGTLAFLDSAATLRVNALYAAIKLSRQIGDEAVRYLDGSVVTAPMDIMRLAKPALDTMVGQMDPNAL